MRKSNHATLPEVVFPSTRNMRRWIFDARANGTLREIGPRLFTTNLTDDPAAIIRRNLWRVVAAYYPDALIADRTALEAREAPDGSVFVISNKTRAMELPGLTIRPRRGMGPLASDRRFMSKLYLSSRPRALP